MAEKVRFELTVLSYTRVPGVHLKPLGHLSALVRSLVSPHVRRNFVNTDVPFDKEKIAASRGWPGAYAPMAKSRTW